jgi:hypothetical protein
VDPAWLLGGLAVVMAAIVFLLMMIAKGYK